MKGAALKGFALLFLFALTATVIAQEKQSDSAESVARSLAANEVLRLESCPDVSSVTPPPIHAKVIWRTPSDVEVQSISRTNDVRVNSYTAVIQYTIRYEQSSFFDTEEEARKATTFRPSLVLKQRNTYTVTSGKLVLLEHESLIGKHWELQRKPVSQFECWASLPKASDH